MRIHQLTVEEALASFQSGASGLTATEARRRLIEFGPNEVHKVSGEPLMFRFLREFTHFFAMILWVAAALAFLAEWRQPGQKMAPLGFAIMGVIAVNGMFSFWQEYRAERAILALQKLLPRQARIIRDGKVAVIPAEKLVPGDVVLLQQGDNIPADCRVIRAFGVRVNTATITGESLPHSRDEHSSTEINYIHSRNVLLAGTSVISCDARGLVFATGQQTAFGQIAHLTQTVEEPPSPLQKEIGRLSRLVAAFSLALGAIVFFIGQAIGLPFWGNAIFAIGMIVANVPEGLLPTVTLALAMGSQRMARRNALIRHLPAVETLGSTTVICTDKTGTLTQDRMTVKRMFLSNRFFAPDERKLQNLKESYYRFFEVARFCHSLEETEKDGRKEWMGDPMEIALVEMSRKVLSEACEFPRVAQIPFDSERRRHSTVYKTADGLVLYTKGAAQVVLSLCARVQTQEEVESLTAEWKQRFLAAQETMADDGLRVLAFAYRMLSEDDDIARSEARLTLVGLVGFEDPPRPEVPAAIQKCQEAGIRVIMLTGDHPHTAKAIARETGLVKSSTPQVMTGKELQRLSDIQLQLSLDAPEIIFARIGADQKMRIVNALKHKGAIVAVTGDGVNDAPALKSADIGIAMGISGTDVARESSDMILLDDNFASIVAAIEEGRAVFGNIRKFLTYILTSNVPELVPYLAFVIFKIPLPLTIIQILAVDLGTDMLPALALGAEKPNPQSMKSPPRSAKERLLNWPLILRS